MSVGLCCALCPRMGKTLPSSWSPLADADLMNQPTPFWLEGYDCLDNNEWQIIWKQPLFFSSIYLFLALKSLLRLNAQVQPGQCGGSGFDCWISSSVQQWEGHGSWVSFCVPSLVLKFWSLGDLAEIT